MTRRASLLVGLFTSVAFVDLPARVLSASNGAGTVAAAQVAGSSNNTPLSAPSAAAARALIDRYCVSCHGPRLRNADLDLASLDTARVSEDAATWEKVVRKLRGGLMPPAGLRRPAALEHEALLKWIEGSLDQSHSEQPIVGRTETFHRLNRAEFRNAIRDLLALDVDVSELLPADSGSYGFDNMAGALKLDQALMERYLGAAQKISRLAVGRPVGSPMGAEFRVPSDLSQYQHVEGLPIGTRGGLSIDYTFPEDAEYVISVELTCGPSNGVATCDGSGGWADPHQLEVNVDGARIELFTLEPTPFGALTEGGWKVRTPIKAGPRKVEVAFIAPPETEEVESNYLRFKKPFFLSVANYNPAFATYWPSVATVTIAGPFNATGPGDTPSRRSIFACRPETAATETSCAKTILARLARRAYRGPVSDADLALLVTFFEEGRKDGGFEAGIELALRRLLVSPRFLFRIERDPDKIRPGENYRLTDFELASRLSFFLWSSIPDDELLDVASRKKLHEPVVLASQVRRMLADGRSDALVKNFAGQWLQLRNIDARVPSEFLFPNFDSALKRAFRRETELFFGTIVQEDKSAVDLLSANYTFVNERLAEHYGIPNVKGSRFRRVTLAEDNPRRGLLGQGSVLLVTSHAIRTSPVIRGKWILETLLGTPPPAPPDNVPPLKEKESQSRGTVLSVRDRMAEHRANAVCASCHSMIDPLGFALENFDAVGQWRTMDESRNPIDASGMLPDGSKFAGLAEFRAILMQHPERLVSTLTEKLLTYALGRGVEYYDMPTVRSIVRGASRDDYRFSSLIHGIVSSKQFQMRRAAPAAAAVAP